MKKLLVGILALGAMSAFASPKYEIQIDNKIDESSPLEVKFNYDLARKMYKRSIEIGTIQTDANLTYDIELDGYDATIVAAVKYGDSLMMSGGYLFGHSQFTVKCKAKSVEDAYIVLNQGCSRKLARKVKQSLRPSLLLKLMN